MSDDNIQKDQFSSHSGGDDGASSSDDLRGSQDSSIAGKASSSGDTGRLPKRDKHLFVIPPHPNTQFDEADFLDLLEGSISLTMEEKNRVIDAIPRLSIDQINELFSIFREERKKFSELEQEFSEDVAKLKAEREKERNIAVIKQEETEEESGSVEEAEELKRKLMGGG